jgi:hypothetical protein
VENDRAAVLAAKLVQTQSELAKFHNQLRVTMSALLPKCARATVVERDGSGVVIAFASGALFLLSAEIVETEWDAELASIRCKRVPLNPLSTRVQVVEQVEMRSGAIVRTRKWSFEVDGTESFSFSAHETIKGGFSGDQHPDDGELLARAIVASLGWDAPTEDVGRDAY